METRIEFYISTKCRNSTNLKLEKYFNKNLCTSIEDGFYNFTEQFCKNCNNITMGPGIYNDAVNNLLFNCKQNSPTIKKLIKNVNNNKFNSYNLAFLRPEELNEDLWIKIIMRKDTTEYKLNNLPTVEWKPCKMCHCTKYFYRQLQTRSADEPMSTFYDCKNCGKTYHVNN